ncbi:LacI family DNA-binding transcriptional regulator [Bogoriella caseilytica]|uniref:LacI family transcriptional regulator n=1 Tax=Bogoriella caseilytica TaxID=56055 RepID=A0A3N2BFQ6_9MICO|nr:LacI family DNA-binding transcriptional regulator [Bogoriella caseilytica]ROR74096.1 LacI family transcriptional regulator [Bogoriella caseilytica]
MAARVTIGELARRLDISTAAVSYALNGQSGVSEETRQRVRALAQELGYHPSSSARALSRARSGAIGVVLTRAPQQIGVEPYYMQVLAGMEMVLAESEMSLLLRVVDAAPGNDLEVYRRWSAERRVDGVVLFDEREDDARFGLLESLGLPAVLQGGPVRGAERYVPPDDAGSARLILGHLRELGHREVLHVGGFGQFMHERRRWRYISAEAQRQQMRACHVASDYTLEGGLEATTTMLSGPDRPTAVIYSNDLMAIGGLRAAQAAGVSIPGELALLSWDDSLLCTISQPAITAVDRHPLAYGRRTAQVLLDVIEGRESTVEPEPVNELRARATTVATRPA